MDRPACEDCRRAYAITRWDTEEDLRRKAGGPPCDSCRPPLHRDNAEAVRVYQLCAGQWIMGFNGPVGLNLLAVESVMRLMGVRDPLTCLKRVQILAAAAIEAMSKRMPKHDASTKPGS